jgi:hypothetical protein
VAIRVITDTLVLLARIAVFPCFFWIFDFFVYICTVTNNLTIMKKMCKDSRINDLMVDVIEYAFIEWLIRQEVFTAFKANYDKSYPTPKSFRTRLRSHVQFVLRNSSLAPSRLISSAFLFTSTPEGANFWRKQSAAWERFCTRFEKTF